MHGSGHEQIIGIDISPEMLRQAEIKRCYSSLIEADITKKIPLENDSIGGIISAGTFTHGHVGPDAIDELIRVIKPGGLFVLSINSKFFKKNGFEEKFIKIKNKISSPIFKQFDAHGEQKENELKEVKIFASIFRKI